MARPYPVEWEADVVLRDGGTAHVRPITPEDADRLRALHRQQSAESIYMRYFAPYPELTDRDVARFTTVDSDSRAALIALVGDEIVGVTRYDKINDDTAELAFMISDRHQGRGLGSVLLEHLAAAARERGVRRFVAEVLPVNRKMIGVLRDAGYEVTSVLDDGVMTLEFDIAPTEHSQRVMSAREHRAEARSISQLLHPSSVAVLSAGATPAMQAAWRAVLSRILDAGFSGSVAAVSADARPDGLEAVVPNYSSLAAVPHPIDLAVIPAPADRAAALVAECAAKGVRDLVVLSVAGSSGVPPAQPGGSDGGGTYAGNALVTLARAHGMRLVGPNAYGLGNTDPSVRLNASLGDLPEPGRVGLFCQTAAVAGSVLQAAQRRSLPLSSFVSAGEQSDVSANDLLQYWEEDPATDVVAMCLETIGNPRKFFRLARRLSRTKPVVAAIWGRWGALDAAGEAGQLAGTQAATAMFRQAGVVGVDRPGDLLDVADLLVGQPLPSGPRVAVVSNSAAMARLATDACAAEGMLVDGSAQVLSDGSASNAVSSAVSAAAGRDSVDSVLCVLAVPPFADPTTVAAVPQAAAHGKTIAVSVVGAAPAGQKAVRIVASPHDAVRALAAAVRYGAWRRREAGTVPDLPDIDSREARRLVEAALSAGAAGAESEEVTAGWLAAVLHCYGIRLQPSRLVTGVREAASAAAALGYPVVLKATAQQLRYRPDLSDVRLNLEDEAQLRAAYEGIRLHLGADAARSMIVQPMAAPGVPCVVASVEDQSLGPVVSLGLSGPSTDLLGDRTYGVPPMTDRDAQEMVSSLRASPLLLGYRGAKRVDTAALEDLLLRVARLADDLPEMQELQLQPVLVARQGLAVLHASARVARPGARPDQGPRRLSG